MQSLIHALNRQRSNGIPLPDRFASLAAAGIRLRRSQLHMVAGQPGSCKSLFALDYAVHSGLSCMYVSADSDYSTVINRVGAMRLGYTTDEIDNMLDSPARTLVEDELSELSHLKFTFAPNPSLDDIEEDLAAFTEVFGAPPDLIIIDNLTNVMAEDGSGNEWEAIRHTMQSFHEMARETQSAVLVLHHTTEGQGKPTEPQARQALMGKPAALPELILTCALDPIEGIFKLAAVKNRSGKADASGGSFVSLSVDLPRMALTEYVPPNQAVAGYWEGIA